MDGFLIAGVGVGEGGYNVSERTNIHMIVFKFLRRSMRFSFHSPYPSLYAKSVRWFHAGAAIDADIYLFFLPVSVLFCFVDAAFVTRGGLPRSLRRSC